MKIVGYTRSMRLLLPIALLSVFSMTLPVNAQDLPSVGSYSDDARAARISELKVKYRISLSDQERTRLIERCDLAKENLGRLSTKVIASSEKRSDVYDGIVSTLTSLRALVATKQVDASNLELLIVDYQRAIADFNIATTAYQTAIDDSLVINCASDPEGFRASIEGVREGRKQSSEAANGVEELTNSNLRTAFDTLKLRLASSGVPDGN
jgi:hypothetical protein